MHRWILTLFLVLGLGAPVPYTDSFEGNPLVQSAVADDDEMGDIDRVKEKKKKKKKKRAKPKRKKHKAKKK